MPEGLEPKFWTCWSEARLCREASSRGMAVALLRARRPEVKSVERSIVAVGTIRRAIAKAMEFGSFVEVFSRRAHQFKLHALETRTTPQLNTSLSRHLLTKNSHYFSSSSYISPRT
jgi:hypothetical protein